MKRSLYLTLAIAIMSMCCIGGWDAPEIGGVAPVVSR